MEIISALCQTGPMKAKECLAFFGVEYHQYLLLLIISLIIGFGTYHSYSRIKKYTFERKKFIQKSLLISLALFIFLAALTIWFQSSIVY